MSDRPTSFSAVIDAFGGAAPFGTAIGIPDSHARTMKARDSIPSTRWQDTVNAARANGIAGITLELLAKLDAERVRHRSVERVA